MTIIVSSTYSIFLSEASIQAIAVFFAVFIALYVFIKRQTNLPPSPRWSFPVVGHLLSLGRAPHLKLTEWRKQYGDVYTVRMGMEDVVILNGHQAIKEAFVDYKDAFSNRPKINTLEIASDGGKDVAFSKFNKDYIEKRKFAVSALRTLGMKMGTGSIEEHIRDESRQLCAMLSAKGDGSPRDIADNLTVSVANIICYMVFGKRYDYDDEDFIEITTLANKVTAEQGASQLTAVFPFLRFIPGANTSYMNLVNFVGKITGFIRNEIARHCETLDSENPRDFIDLILIELNCRKRTDGFTEENIVWMVYDMFVAGIDTTAITLRWSLLYMVKLPEEQQKVQVELDSVLGKDHFVPTLSQRSQLPYTEATIMEIMRIRTIVPFGLPHAPVQDTSFRGYAIPAGTQVLANLWSAHMDPEYWPDPEKFDPCRFLDSDGKVVNRPDSFFPFSAGRRVCLGEQLARMELFLLFSSLLKHFTFKIPCGAAPPSTDGRFGLTLVPPSVKMCITQR